MVPELEVYNPSFEPRSIKGSPILNFDEYNRTTNWTDEATSIGQEVKTISNEFSTGTFSIASKPSAPKLYTLGVNVEGSDYFEATIFGGMLPKFKINLWFEAHNETLSGTFVPILTTGSVKVLINTATGDVKFEPDEGTSTAVNVLGELNAEGLNNISLVVDNDADFGWLSCNGAVVFKGTLGLASPLGSGWKFFEASSLDFRVFRAEFLSTSATDVINTLQAEYNDNLSYFSQFVGG